MFVSGIKKHDWIVYEKYNSLIKLNELLKQKTNTKNNMI